MWNDIFGNILDWFTQLQKCMLPFNRISTRALELYVVCVLQNSTDNTAYLSENHPFSVARYKMNFWDECLFHVSSMPTSMLWYFIVNLLRIIQIFYVYIFLSLGFCWTTDLLFLIRASKLLCESTALVYDFTVHHCHLCVREIETGI